MRRPGNARDAIDGLDGLTGRTALDGLATVVEATRRLDVGLWGLTGTAGPEGQEAAVEGDAGRALERALGHWGIGALGRIEWAGTEHGLSGGAWQCSASSHLQVCRLSSVCHVSFWASVSVTLCIRTLRGLQALRHYKGHYDQKRSRDDHDGHGDCGDLARRVRQYGDHNGTRRRPQG
ncbi:hypothetical protein AOQ84DRAFT_223022 [Glonium stellatum]|uniref:Uncharacterized protein n=1 Tax=Glonium stellatum TaxID=574774 RepID=A0A8E2EYK2_9PEZI|nr:hypothetical protein AOQ84DRAFT_223022 [Glonium stellatum]